MRFLKASYLSHGQIGLARQHDLLLLRRIGIVNMVVEPLLQNVPGELRELPVALPGLADGAFALLAVFGVAVAPGVGVDLIGVVGRTLVVSDPVGRVRLLLDDVVDLEQLVLLLEELVDLPEADVLEFVDVDLDLSEGGQLDEVVRLDGLAVFFDQGVDLRPVLALYLFHDDFVVLGSELDGLEGAGGWVGARDARNWSQRGEILAQNLVGKEVDFWL